MWALEHFRHKGGALLCPPFLFAPQHAAMHQSTGRNRRSTGCTIDITGWAGGGNLTDFHRIPPGCLILCQYVCIPVSFEGADVMKSVAVKIPLTGTCIFVSACYLGKLFYAAFSSIRHVPVLSVRSYCKLPDDHLILIGPNSLSGHSLKSALPMICSSAMQPTMMFRLS